MIRLRYLAALLLALACWWVAGCGDAYEHRQHPCGYENGSWVYHKPTHQNVQIDHNMFSARDFVRDENGHTFTFACSDLSEAKP